MARERSVQSCLIVAGVLSLVVITILWAAMDRIKDSLGLEEPDSEVGQKIDENIPQIQGVRTFQRNKLVLQQAQMKAIKDAYVMYYVLNDRYAESLQELIDAGQLPYDAAKDFWGHQYIFIRDGLDAYLICAGGDRIRLTGDDLIVSLTSPNLEIPATMRGQILQMAQEKVLKGEV
jgi:hypothetical protein